LSLTEKRETEASRLREKIAAEMKSHPAVGELISKHGARIKEIKILKEP
jgi:hypothetical protein